jgi:TonB-dependent starch-binding outer membrane protein SusC
MKNELAEEVFPSRKNLTKLLQIMRIILLLSTVCLMHVSAASYSQEKQFDLKFQGKLGDVLKAIENSSEFRFFYNESEVDISRNIIIDVEAKKIDAVLNQVFEGTGTRYEIYDRYILLHPNDKSQAATDLKTEALRQQHIIVGTVSDEKGVTMPGVNITIKGTTKGVVSNADGKYSIEVSTGSDILVFSFIGYVTQEQTAGDQKTIDVTLAEEFQSIDEVVVVGYGTMKKRDLTGSISQVQGSELKDVPLRNAVDALQGKTAGVMITATSGSPGSISAVRIRGVGTVNDNSPLFVVDGLPQGDISWLNPSDIEGIEILKDASATAIYGSRAANGVILVTTRRGSTSENGKIDVTLNSYFGWQNFNKTEHMMNASQFIDFKNLANTNAGGDVFYTPEQKNQILNFLRENTGSENGTDWMKEITHKNAPVQNHDISVSGGSKNFTYHTSLAYMQQDGIVNGSDYNRISWRTTTDSKVTKWFKLSGNFGLISEARHNVYEEETWDYGTIFNAMAADPITPVYRTNLKNIPDFLESSFFLDKIDPQNPFSFYSPILLTNKLNSVAQIDIMQQSVWKGISLKGGMAGDIDFTPWLKFHSSVGLDLGRGMSSGFTPKYYLNGNQNNIENTVSRWIGFSNYMVFENYLTFDKSFGDHHVLAMAGISSEKSTYEDVSASKQGLVNNDPIQRTLNSATINPGVSGGMSDGSMASYFGRLFYSFKDKYMLTANVREDGSSNFAKGHKWGLFPSFSFGWTFNKESFMENVSWLNTGKFRASWGQIGNQSIGSGAYLSSYSANQSYYIFGSDYLEQLTGGFSQIGNPQVQWETTQQTDIGIDLELFNKRFTVSTDYFDKQTKDMLLEVPLPTTLGLPNNPIQNAGSISNRGLELDMKYHGNAGDFRYTIGGNLFTFRNKVVSLGGGEPIYEGWYVNYTTTKTEERQPIGYFYGLKTNGIFQSQSEVDEYTNGDGASIQDGARPGDLRYVDMNGTDANGNVISGPDGKISDADRTMIGNPFPKFTYGFNLTLNYKGFDITMLFQGSQGNDIMNVKKIDFQSGVGWYNAPSDLMEKAWTEQNHSTSQFKISTDNLNNLKISDWLVEDGSYLRLKNFQIGYTLPEKLMHSYKIQNLRVWVGGYNLLTFTHYSGLDPEIGSSSPLTNGIDYGYYPQARSIMVGLSASF